MQFKYKHYQTNNLETVGIIARKIANVNTKYLFLFDIVWFYWKKEAAKKFEKKDRILISGKEQVFHGELQRDGLTFLHFSRIFKCANKNKEYHL